MKWTRALLRERIGLIAKGADIAYAYNPIRLAVGPTWVIIDLDTGKVAHVAESYAGIGAYRLIKPMDGRDHVAGPRTTAHLDSIANKFLNRGHLNESHHLHA